MSRTTRVVAVAALLVLAGVAVPAAGQETDVVTMTVAVEDRAGDPVRNATVTASWDGGSATVRTAANGKAFVDAPADARVELRVDHPRYVRNEPYVVEDAEAEEVTVDVSRRGEIAVRVTDAAGPVADAAVAVRKDGRVVVRGQTNADGRFRTGAVERGEYTVAAVRRGYYRNVTAVDVEGNVTAPVVLRQGSVTLTFEVVDRHFDPPRPVGNATLEVGSLGQVRTLTGGEAKMQVPVNSRPPVTASKQGYQTVSRPVDVNESDRTVRVGMGLTPSLNLTPVNERTVAGESVVVDVTDEYGDPVEGATVVLDGESVATTDANGRASVRIDETGRHRLAARTSNLTSDPATVRAVAGDETTAGAATGTGTRTATTGTNGGGGTDGTTTSTPGFTTLTGVVALLAAAAVLATRRR